jgi:thiamine biosynthesis protein ThiS
MVPLRRVLLTLRRRMDCRLRALDHAVPGLAINEICKVPIRAGHRRQCGDEHPAQRRTPYPAASATLHDLLQAEQLLQRRVAVEVNGEIVSRSRHGEHVLAEGDVVEIDTRWAGAEACAGVQGSDPFADGKGI